MKKVLLCLLVVLACITTHAKNKFIAKAEWGKPLESISLDYYYPEYYPANYWEPGQPAGYYLAVALTGMHEGTWGLSINVQTLQGGVLSWETFVFLVTPCYAYYHTHILPMQDQMNAGETIPWDAGLSLNHWWIVT